MLVRKKTVKLSISVLLLICRSKKAGVVQSRILIELKRDSQEVFKT